VRNLLLVRNRQRTRPVNTRLLRWMMRHLLQELLDIESYDLCVTLISDRAMTRLNEEHLRHAGTTDVITFDYNDPATPDRIRGEIFVSVDEAITQAKRFRTSWPAEVVRYVVHGILHLVGHEDGTAEQRRAMKRDENRFLKALDGEFRLEKLGKQGA
jgi:rRNA maturation RNase YbeY